MLLLYYNNILSATSHNIIQNFFYPLTTFQNQFPANVSCNHNINHIITQFLSLNNE